MDIKYKLQSGPFCLQDGLKAIYLLSAFYFAVLFAFRYKSMQALDLFYILLCVLSFSQTIWYN